MKNLIFLCSSIFIIILSIICLCLAPSINNLVSKSEYYTPCNALVDEYNFYKKLIEKVEPPVDKDTKEKALDFLKEPSTICYRHKAKIGLEYSAFIINVVFAFFCTLFFLLNKFKIVGFLGIFTGLVGFVLTLCYVIYSGIIFTQEIINKGDDYERPYSYAYPRIKSNGAYLEWDDDKKSYTCIFYSENHNDSLYMTYSDYGNNYLYYLKERDNPDEDERDSKFTSCTGSKDSYPYTRDNPNITAPNNLYDYCKMLDEKTIRYSFDGNMKKYIDKKNQTQECEEMLMNKRSFSGLISTSSNLNKIIYQYWVTTIVFSCFIFVLDLVLLIIGVLFIKNPDESGDPLL